MAGRLLFDATGLLQWYGYFWQPSGIQRVTERLLASDPLRQHPRLECVVRILGSDEFHHVDLDALTALSHQGMRGAAVARLRGIFAQSMGLATWRGLQTEAKSFHLPYVALGRTGLGSLVEPWYERHWPAAMPPLRRVSLPDSLDTFFNPGDFWCHDGYVDAVLRLKRRTGVRLVQMIHDLFAVDHPEWHHPRFGRVVAEGIDKLALPVDRWLTNSEFVRNDLAAFLGRRSHPSPPPITAIPMGWDSFREPGASGGHADRAVLARHGLSDKSFILHVGTVEPRKNLVILLDALAHLRRELGSSVPDCVLVGRDGWRSEALRRRLRDTGNEQGTVHWFRSVSDRDLPAFYHGARFSIVPSHAEGWGLPVQESLAHGVPCIASDVGALRECGGDLAVYFDPADSAGLKRVLAAWITSDRALGEMRMRICRALRTQRFPTWHDAAETVMAAVV